MAANLSNIAFFDISEDQFTGIKPLEFTVDFGGSDYTDEELDEFSKTYGEAFKSFANFAIQIDVDKKITLGHLGEYILQSESLWKLATRNGELYPQWYQDLQNAINSTKNVIGSTSPTTRYWTWSRLINGYGGLIPLIEEISSLLGSISLESDTSDTVYRSWSDWKDDYSSITGWIRDNSGYLDKILGTNWTSYDEFNSLPIRILRLEGFTGVPTGGSVLPKESLSQKIENINTALGKKSDKAGTDTVYGRLNQLETLKDSSSQLSDTIGEFSTGSGGDPLTNKVNDLKTKKATIHDIYQYLNYSQTTNATDNPVSYPLEDPLLTPDHNMITLWAKRTGFFQGYRTTYISDPGDTLKWNHRYEFELVPYNQRRDFKIPTDMSSEDITRYLNVLPRLTIERLKSYITRGNNTNSLWPSNMDNPPGMTPMINQVLSHIRAYVRGGGIATANHLFPVAYFKGGGEYLLYGNIPGKDVLGVVTSNIPVTPSLGDSNMRRLVTWAPEEDGDPMNYGDPVFMVHNPILSLPSGNRDGKYYLCDSAIIDIWLHATDDFSQVIPLVEITFLPNCNGAVISDTLIMS